MQAQIEVVPVDTRISCLSNLVTSQINLFFLDILRGGLNLFRKEAAIKKSEPGGVTLARRDPGRMRLIYFLLRLNPINFLLGLISWTMSQIPIRRSFEGEITSGYLIKVVKA